ncbi:DeoR/GlpR family DNA-binding transcription regulator [Paralimibaculum aggregatum]|uniref:DeoR/GlpR family DNA-binding transcription regulator n=1 Tax=Paralimibaculum aggregatum TaxID=3036245 RepID=A0ABQ6LTH2_9RHOB|nr:DeoR/GlpR family DNA-binding transcription regulator [Limibaculum sp. NKW23]
MTATAEEKPRERLRKADRRAQILLELKFRPHVRISELAERFSVSTETVRRDLDGLSADGLISRAHGGATAPGHGHFPSFEERSRARLEERERIGRFAAGLIEPGATLMVDSGSTTLQFARFLAFAGTPCTVITNSLPIATTLGESKLAEVILCPGDYLPSEAAVIGTETVDFLNRHRVGRSVIGASALMQDGPAESVRGFAAVKRAMIGRSTNRTLLIDSEKFGRSGFSRVGPLEELSSIVVDRAPDGTLAGAIAAARVEILLADGDKETRNVTSS